MDERTKARNVLGGEIESCCTSPMTGFYRDGCCNTGDEDVGAHVVCSEVTEEFLAFSRQAGNDLSTCPQYQHSARPRPRVAHHVRRPTG